MRSVEWWKMSTILSWSVRGRLAREVLLVEVGEKVAGKEKLLQWVLGGFVEDGIEWGAVVGRFLRRVWELRGGLEKPRRGKN